MVTIDIQGIPALLQQLQRLSTTVVQPLGDALYDEGHRIMADSVERVPEDTTRLRSTAHVGEPVTRGLGIEVELRYGGYGLAPYAIVQHEDVTLHHPNGREAKYLQTPLLAAIAGMPARLGTDLLSALRR